MISQRNALCLDLMFVKMEADSSCLRVLVYVVFHTCSLSRFSDILFCILVVELSISFRLGPYSRLILIYVGFLYSVYSISLIFPMLLVCKRCCLVSMVGSFIASRSCSMSWIVVCGGCAMSSAVASPVNDRGSIWC